MVTASITNTISPVAFAEQFCTFMVQRVAANHPLTTSGPGPQDVNYYMGPPQTDVTQYEHPLGTVVKAPFLPTDPLNKEHAKALGTERICLNGIMETARDLDGTTDQADKQPFRKHIRQISEKASRFRQQWMDDRGVTGTVLSDIGVADRFLAQATVLAASNDHNHKKSAADKLKKAASYYATGERNQSAAAISEIAALLYLSAAKMITPYNNETLLHAIYSHYRSANYWLGAPLGTDEKGVGIFRGIRNWLVGTRLYASYRSKPFAFASRYAPLEIMPSSSEDSLLAGYIVQHQDLDCSVISSLLEEAARWHTEKDLEQDAANDGLFKLFIEMERLDYITLIRNHNWTAMSQTLEQAASTWEKAGKPTDVVTEMRNFASIAKAIAEKS